jgi:CRISPR-associated protein Csc3
MFTQEFLLQKIPPGDIVARDFITAMVQPLFALYADASAKGGDHREGVQHELINEELRVKYEDKDDQTMVSHLLNGIFPTLRLLTILEQEGLSSLIADIVRRVYVLSYLSHDIDKIFYHDAIAQGLHATEQIETQDRAHIEHTKALFDHYLYACGAKDFFPAYRDYLEDIVYLAVNTQRKWHTHLNTSLWNLRLRERHFTLLRNLCRYSDIMAYLVPMPSAILLGEDTEELRAILKELSEGKLEFCYHQLREVRGLITNVVNTGIIHLMTNDREGIWPYLFFSDGVVYIKRKSLALALTTQQMTDAVKSQLRQSCANVIQHEAPGFKFSIQGIAKHPDYYFEFLGLPEYIDLLQESIISRTRNDTFTGTWAKMRMLQANGEIPTSISFDMQPDGPTASIMTRFLSVVFVSLLGLLDKSQQTLQKEVETAVLRHLELTDYWEQSKAIPNKGGVEYRWFWLAACYLHHHQGLSISGEEQSLKTIFASTFKLMKQMAGEVMSDRLPQKYLQHLPLYLESSVELPATIRVSETLPDFSAEFAHYELAKSKKRTLLCTLCNSAYPAEEQADSTVLFQPWVYKNKLSLYAGKNAGGICAICSLELMLRQILLKGQLRLTGSKFESQKAKYIAVYPNFFFTHETGALISNVLQQLKDINFFTVRHDLGERDLTIKEVFQFNAFVATPQPEARVVELGDDDDEDDEDSAIVEESEQAPVQIVDRTYIKYQPEEYPGLFIFGMRGGKDNNDTASWAMPAFLALSLPLVTSTKVVISEMSLPLFASGRDFYETVVFDAPHPYLDYALQEKRIRVNRILPTLQRLYYLYRINIDTYAKQGKPEWSHLSAIARELETDPLYVFSYLRRQDRINSAFRSNIGFYLHIFECITEEKMSESLIAQCVDRYAAFYRGGYQSHSILKPIDIIARAIINSPLNIEPEDLHWQIRGEIKSWLDRVRSGNATGWAVFPKKDIMEKQQPAVRTFVEYFYHEVFLEYCQGERGILRSRINRFKDGCEAYYTYTYPMSKKGPQNQAEEQEPEQLAEQDPATELVISDSL